MKNLYVLVGLPGSGKSTFAAEHPEMVVVSSDAVRGELYGDESIQCDHARVFGVVNQRVREALNNGSDVIYDATSLTRKVRKNIIKMFSDANIIAVFFNTDVNVCIERDRNRTRTVGANVIQRMSQRMTEPTTEEGFKEIVKK